MTSTYFFIHIIMLLWHHSGQTSWWNISNLLVHLSVFCHHPSSLNERWWRSKSNTSSIRTTQYYGQRIITYVFFFGSILTFVPETVTAQLDYFDSETDFYTWAARTFHRSKLCLTSIANDLIYFIYIINRN